MTKKSKTLYLGIVPNGAFQWSIISANTYRGFALYDANAVIDGLVSMDTETKKRLKEELQVISKSQAIRVYGIKPYTIEQSLTALK